MAVSRTRGRCGPATSRFASERAPLLRSRLERVEPAAADRRRVAVAAEHRRRPARVGLPGSPVTVIHSVADVVDVARVRPVARSVDSEERRPVGDLVHGLGRHRPGHPGVDRAEVAEGAGRERALVGAAASQVRAKQAPAVIDVVRRRRSVAAQAQPHSTVCGDSSPLISSSTRLGSWLFSPGAGSTVTWVAPGRPAAAPSKVPPASDTESATPSPHTIRLNPARFSTHPSRLLGE